MVKLGHESFGFRGVIVEEVFVIDHIAVLKQSNFHICSGFFIAALGLIFSGVSDLIKMRFCWREEAYSWALFTIPSTSGCSMAMPLRSEIKNDGFWIIIPLFASGVSLVGFLLISCLFVSFVYGKGS